MAVTLPSFGADLTIQYETVARTGETAIPEGDGAFNGFSEAPAIDGDGNVVFVGAGPRDNAGIYQSGIYTFINGQYQKVADKNTLIPDGSGAKFTTFYGSDLNDIDTGRVAFRANTATVGTLLGLYTNVGQPSSNDLVELAIEDGIEWSETSHPWVDGNKVAMRGKLPSGSTEILLWDSSDLSMNYVEPGVGYVVSPGNQASESVNATIFRRYKTGSSQMVIDTAGDIEVLATIGSTPLPGQPGEVFSNLSYFPVTDQGGQDAAFQGTGGAIRGLYKRVNGGALESVADTSMTVPGTASNVFYFFIEQGISLANGQVAFFAEGQSFLNGIYTDIGGGLSVIVDDQDNNMIELDGQLEQVSDIRFSHKSFSYTPDGYMVVFRATLQSGGTAIIRATINDGTGPEPVPDISVSGSGALGDVEVGTNKYRTFTVSNVGNANLVIGNLYGLANPFFFGTNNCSGQTLAPAGSCTFVVRFSPTTTGLRSDTVIIPSNDPDEPSVNLGVSGTGITTSGDPDIAVSGNGAFGDVSVGASSTHNITVGNAGTGNLTINNMFGLAAPFSVVSDGCSGQTIAPDGSCVVGVRFAPTTTDPKSDVLIISSNDPDQGYYGFSVNGTGTTAAVPDISVSGSGAFGDVTTGTSSTKSITVSNAGNANLVIGNLYGLSAPFSTVTDNCSGRTIAPAGSCTVSIRFAPTVTGLRSDTLVIPSNDPDEASVNFGVSGTGTTTAVPDIAVSGSGAFGDVTTGTSSTKSITVSNAGNANLVIGNLYGLSAPFSTVTDNCSGRTIAPAGSCTVSIRFAPTVTGLRSDTLVIPSNDPDEASVNFGVSGTGISTSGEPDISVSGNGAFGEVATGTSSTHNITVSNVGGANLVINNMFGLAAPFSVASDGCSGQTIAPAGSCVVGVRFAPTTTDPVSDMLVISSNDPDRAYYGFSVNGAGTTASVPNISVSGNGAFGNVEVGTSSTRNISVSNTGNANLVIGSLYGLATPFSVATDNCSGQTIAPAGSCAVSVRFSPTNTSTSSDTLVIPSNDPDEPSFNFGVSGTGSNTSAPDISVSGNGAFGDLQTGTNSTRSISVTNVGSADLVIGNLYGLAAPFSIVSNACTGATIAPANSCAVSIRFAPTVTGLRSDTLVIPSNDPDEPSVNFGVSGTGTEPAQEEVIINEGFEDGNANGWTLTGNVAVDGILAIGNYSLRHGQGGTSEFSISTAGYSGVSVTMKLAATALKRSGGCYAEVSTNGGSTWSQVIEILRGGDDGAFVSSTVSPAGADDNLDLQLRFRALDGKGGGYCYGDDISVSGTPNG